MATFEASQAALGYFYQSSQALAFALEADLDQSISVEVIDDILIEEQGEAIELIQTKHHISRKANLTDRSPDLWKSIRVWSVAVAGGAVTLGRCRMTLLTTGHAPEGSVAQLLKHGPLRNTGNAWARLATIAQEVSEANNAAYEAFNALSIDQQKRLLAEIYVIDDAPTIVNIEKVVKKHLLRAVRPHHLDSLFTRVLGWWTRQVILRLATPALGPLRASDLQAAMNDFSDEFTPAALPIDFEGEEIQLPHIPDDRMFVRQLALINANPSQILNAKRNYYKAFEQRSRWISEELTNIDELEAFEERLVDEYRNYREYVIVALSPTAAEGELVQAGQRVMQWADHECEARIRPGVTASYVRRGSFQMLTDEDNPRVGWHPHFRQRLGLA